MNTHSDTDRSTRIVCWWARRYTAGLPQTHGADRRAEIDSDLAEHRLARIADVWTKRRIASERLTRLVRGAPADLAWRHELLHRATNRVLAAAVSAVTAVASLLLAAYYVAFAAYLLGSTSLAEQRVLGRLPLRGFVGYEDQAGAVLVFGGAGLVLTIATVARPIAPLVANVAALQIAIMSVMLFWLGVWPVALVAVAGSVTDLALRGSQTTAPR